MSPLWAAQRSLSIGMYQQVGRVNWDRAGLIIVLITVLIMVLLFRLQGMNPMGEMVFIFIPFVI